MDRTETVARPDSSDAWTPETTLPKVDRVSSEAFSMPNSLFPDHASCPG